MTQTVPATAALGPGLTGLTIGLRVLNLDGTTYAAFATTGVAETSVAGTYRKAGGVVVPDAGAYIVWGTAGTDYAEATVDAVDTATILAALAVIDANVDELLEVDTSSSDATAAGSITRRRGDSWSISLTIGAITGYTSLWFTVKSSTDNLDSAAIVQIKLNASGLSDGLLYINGAAASNDALGSITVSDATTGAIVVALDETMTDDLAPGSYSYDVQTLISGAVATPDSGTFTITADTTRSVL